MGLIRFFVDFLRDLWYAILDLFGFKAKIQVPSAINVRVE